MKHLSFVLSATLLCLLLPLTSAPAATLLKTWTLDGGGLDPDTYGGNYKPVLTPDTATGSGASIAMTGLTSGGIGSSGFPDGYGGIYTFFAAPVGFTLNSTSVLPGVETITFSFSAGGGNPDLINFGADDLTLNFNLANTDVTNTSFSKSAPFAVDSPIGTQNLNIYSWSWDVSTLGPSSGFSITWATPGTSAHAFLTDLTLTQTSAVPEPSTYALIALGLAALWILRRSSERILS